MEEKLDQAVQNCDVNGPATVFISKMMPVNLGRGQITLIAFSRIFSGTVTSGEVLKLIHENQQRVLDI